MIFRPEGFEITADRWEQLHDAYERGYPVEGRVVRVTWEDDRPVWELDMGEGIKGLVPSSETGLGENGLMKRFVGQRVFVKVKGFDKENRIVALSRREAIADAEERFFAEAKEGMKIPVVVKAILSRDNEKGERLLVDVGGGVTVEVPRKQATRSLVARLGELYRPGMAAEATVLQVDKQTRTIRVSLLDDGDPWDSFDAKRGDFLAGRVVGIRGDVVLLEVKPGITGIANLPLRGRLRRGDIVPVTVNTFNREEKKLRLRIRGGKLA